MVPRLRPRRTFPKNRFRLEWFDVLLEKPLFVPLNEPTITIGLAGKNTWNIPIEAFQVDGLRDSMPPWDSPLVTLTYDVQTHTWSSRRHHPEWPAYCQVTTSVIHNMFPDTSRSIPIDYPAVPLEIGATLEIHLRDDGDMEDNHGSITVMLVDMYPSRATLGSSDGRPLFTDMLAALPAIPLAIIAGYLGPHDCLKNLCALSPAIPQKLRTVGVSWPVLQMLPLPEEKLSAVKPQETLLDCLRAARIANKHAVTSFGLGEQVDCKDAGDMVRLLWPRVKNFLLGTMLEELHLACVWFDEQILYYQRRRGWEVAAPLPTSTLKRLTVHRGVASDDQHFCQDFWDDFDVYGLGLSGDTEVSLSCTKTLKCEEKRRIWRESDEEDFPVKYEDDAVEIAPMPNVKALSWLFCDCKAWIPFKAFPNLRKMHLDLLDFSYGDLWEPYRYKQVADEVGQASMPLLKEVSFCAGMNGMCRLLEATARAAPNVEYLKWEGDPVDHQGSRFFSSTILSSVAVIIIGNFLSLRRLHITLRPPVVVKVEILMNFCLRMPTGVSPIVVENVECSDPADSGIQEEVVRLIANNKQVTLEPADGSGVGRISYPLTGPVDGGHGGNKLYNLIVCNAPDS